MENLWNLQFVPSHYPCIGKYEVDICSRCYVGCIYCSLKKKIPVDGQYTDIPADLCEKGIYLSPNSDPFQRVNCERTHEVLEYFLPRGVPFLIITKSNIPDNTLALLATYSSQVYVQISLSRIDHAINVIVEPWASSGEQRVEMMRSLLALGIRTVPIMMPLFPGIDDTDESLLQTIQACASVGVTYFKAAYVVLDIRDLDVVNYMNSHPLLRKSFEEMDEYADIHVGGGLTVSKQRRLLLYERIADLCSSYGIQFQACPILDPAVVKMQMICLCASYKKKLVNK